METLQQFVRITVNGFGYLTQPGRHLAGDLRKDFGPEENLWIVGSDKLLVPVEDYDVIDVAAGAEFITR